ncbi:hypothetical protein [Mycobacterium sp. 23]|uniref:hypothetical protein n=1 Tax=Mycobacterium sp. 23 TaxID=3400424 RepID=UPI003AAA7681
MALALIPRWQRSLTCTTRSVSPTPIASRPATSTSASCSVLAWLADAATEVAYHAVRGDVWFGVNPTRLPVGSTVRGAAAQVTRLTSVWADLDVKPGGFAGDSEAHACIDELSGVLGSRAPGEGPARPRAPLGQDR